MTRSLTKWLFILTFLMVGTGIIFVYSASAPYAAKDGLRQFSQILTANKSVPEVIPSLHSTKFLVRQFMWSLVAILGMFVVMRIDYGVHRRYAYVYMLVAVALLALCFVPGFGVVRYGARRWIHIGPLQIQPSEFAKTALVICFAKLLSEPHSGWLRPRVNRFLLMLGLLAISCGLIVLEPDLGTCVVIGAVTLAMWAVGGLSIRFLAGMIVLGVIGVAVGIVAEPYRVRRVLAFLDPEKDPLGSGYHLLNSLIAVGTGGLTGRGIANGPAKYYFLSECHTDFIFSIICEEAGFIGATAIILLFVAFTIIGLQVAKRAEDKFGRLVALGISLLIGVQGLGNVMVALGMLPTKGLALPLISYGGSSLLANMLALGIMMNIAIDVEELRNRAYVGAGTSVAYAHL